MLPPQQLSCPQLCPTRCGLMHKGMGRACQIVSHLLHTWQTFAASCGKPPSHPCCFLQCTLQSQMFQHPVEARKVDWSFAWVTSLTLMYFVTWSIAPLFHTALISCRRSATLFFVVPRHLCWCVGHPDCVSAQQHPAAQDPVLGSRPHHAQQHAQVASQVGRGPDVFHAKAFPRAYSSTPVKGYVL